MKEAYEDLRSTAEALLEHISEEGEPNDDLLDIVHPKARREVKKLVRSLYQEVTRVRS